MGYKIPTSPSQLTGTITARVTGAKEVSSRFGAQLEFEFTSSRGNRLKAWMTLDSSKQVEMYIGAGILRVISDGEFDITPMGLQPTVKVVLEKGKVKEFKKAE